MSSTRRILPGFGITLGYTILYLSFIVLLPILMVPLKASEMSLIEFWHTVSEPRALAAYRLTFGASFLAALCNLFFGVLVAWVLVRYSFPGKRIVDAMIDLPFALPTAVAGIALTALYAPTGWIGSITSYFSVQIAYTPLGIFIALAFVGLPFVVRSVQPVLADFEPDLEEAAATLGASRWQTFSRVIAPTLLPACLTGFSLAFARGLGEYGSIIFISGNMPLQTEIVPLLIMTKLEEFDYKGAVALALVMLVVSLMLMLFVNLLTMKIARKQRIA